MNLADYTWHALYCHPQREMKTARELRWAFGVETVIPAEKKWRQRGRCKREVYLPAFPQYIFTGFLSPPNWQEIRERVSSVYGYMTFGIGGPSVLPVSAMRRLCDLHDEMAGKLEPKPFHETLKPGDQARVSAANAMLPGRIVTVSAVVSKEIHAYTEMLGGMVLVKIPLGKLEPV